MDKMKIVAIGSLFLIGLLLLNAVVLVSSEEENTEKEETSVVEDDYFRSLGHYVCFGG